MKSVQWSLVVPVKGRAFGKQRLAELGEARGDAAIAFALDTILAVRAAELVGEIVLVSNDREVIEATAADPRVKRLADPARGLGPAIAAGIAAASLDSTAVLLGDLPSLDAPTLDAALRAAATVPLGMVSDANGTGTTMLSAQRRSMLMPQFGQDSAIAHRAIGHEELEAGIRLRRDVDTIAELDEALTLGVGPATAELAARIGRLPR